MIFRDIDMEISLNIQVHDDLQYEFSFITSSFQLFHSQFARNLSYNQQTKKKNTILSNKQVAWYIVWLLRKLWEKTRRKGKKIDEILSKKQITTQLSLAQSFCLIKVSFAFESKPHKHKIHYFLVINFPHIFQESNKFLEQNHDETQKKKIQNNKRTTQK